jgi:hypothetical protein
MQNQNNGANGNQGNGMNQQQPVQNPYFQNGGMNQQQPQNFGNGMNQQQPIQNPYFQNGGMNQQQHNPYLNHPVPTTQYGQQHVSMLPSAPQVSFDKNDFLKGALIGAGVAYLLTNEKVQNGLMKVVAKGTQLFQTGFEEMKERYEDAKAEVESEK